MSEFWIGYFTFPAGILIGWLLGKWLSTPIVFYPGRGWSVAYRPNRSLHSVTDQMLEDSIWYEKQHGPLFSGHWYHDGIIVRWWAIGKREGMNLTIFHERAMSND